MITFPHGITDEEIGNARDACKAQIGFYGSTPAYWPVLETHGYGDLGRKLNAMTKSGEWDQLAAQIPDDLLELFCAIGRYDEIAKHIEERFGNMTDVISTGLNEDFPPDLIQDIQKIEGSFVGFNTD